MNKQKAIEYEVKFAKIKINPETKNIQLKGDKLNYECYFNEGHYVIFVGEEGNGRLIEFKPPFSDTDRYSMRVWNKW